MILNRNYVLSQRLGTLLFQRGWRLVLAESCTGGGFASEITAVNGSSAWFDRGFVTYSNASKMDLLGVQADTLAQFGAVSEQTAREMAKGALARSDADVALSVTGIAGPCGGTPDKPVGMVWFGLAYGDHVEARLGQFTSGRKHVRRSAVAFGLEWLLEIVA